MQRQTDAFEIEDEQGTRYRVYEYVDIPRKAGTGAEPESKDEGPRLYQTSEGHRVNRLSADEFEIVELGIVAIRV